MADDNKMPYTGLAGAIQAFGQPVTQAIGSRIMDESAIKRIADLMRAERNALEQQKREAEQQLSTLTETLNRRTRTITETTPGGETVTKEVEIPEDVKKSLEKQLQPQLVSALGKIAETERKIKYLDSNPVTGALLRGDVKRSKDLQALGLVQYPEPQAPEYKAVTGLREGSKTGWGVLDVKSGEWKEQHFGKDIGGMVHKHNFALNKRLGIYCQRHVKPDWKSSSLKCLVMIKTQES